MENYGTKNNEDDDDILDGKKNKKAEQGSGRSAVEAQEDAKAEARKSLLELFAAKEKTDGAEITLFPEAKDEAPKPKTEDGQPKEELIVPAEQADYPLPQPDANIEPSDPEAAINLDPTAPAQPKAASRLEDLFKEQPIFNQFRAQENRQEPEPVRPVSGYNREDAEYFTGYVPGVVQESRAYEPPTATGGNSGGGNVPPRTPLRSGDAAPEPDGGRLPNLASAEHSTTRPNFTGVQANQLASKHEDEVYTAERRGLRHGVVAGFLTGYILKAYLAGKRRKREAGEFQKHAEKQDQKIKQIQGEDLQKQKRLSEQEKYIQRLQDEQQKIRLRFEERLAAQQPQAESRPKPVVFKPEKPAVSPELAAVPLANVDGQQEKPDDKKVDMVEAARKALEEAVDKEDNKKRIEQDAWLRHVLDEHGQEVQGVVRGQEYKHERAQELLQRDHAQPHQQSSHKAAAQPAFTGTIYQDSSVQQTYSQPTLPSGQVPVDHQLSNGDRPSPYFSSKKNSTLVSALTSPWTFLMLSLILLAYFIATLI